MIITYVTDQYRKILSGPGVFANIIEQDAGVFGYKLHVICLEKLLYLDLRIKILNKVKTVVTILLYSILTTYSSISKKTDVVLVNSFYLMLLSFNKRKCTIFVNDVKFLDSQLRLYLALFVLKRCKLIIANSRYVALQLEGLGLSNIKILQKSLPDDYYSRNFVRKVTSRMLDQDGQLRLLFVKTDWKTGGLRETVLSLSKVVNRRFHIKIVGIPPAETDEVEILCAGLLKPSEYTVLGHLRRAKIIDEYLHADVFINNCRIEAFCVAAIEAAACGCSVVAVNYCNGLNQLMSEEKFGLCIDTISDLSGLIEKIDMNDLIASNIQKSLKIRNRFHPNKMRRNMYTILKSEYQI